MGTLVPDVTERTPFLVVFQVQAEAVVVAATPEEAEAKFRRRWRRYLRRASPEVEVSKVLRGRKEVDAP